MTAGFIDLETCRINGNDMVYFMHPSTLRDRFIETVEKIGGERFFSSPENDVKRNREGIAEYFFILALKKGNGQEWFLMQPKDDPPDFKLMTFNVNNEITLDSFELVTIPSQCQTLEAMTNIVQAKLDKKYSEKYNLLIFVNNDKGDEWIKLFHKKLKDCDSFKTVWTIQLLLDKNTKEIGGSLVNRLHPYPAKSIRVALNDDALKKEFLVPKYIEEVKIDGKSFLTFKSDFSKELTKMMRKINITRLRIKNN